MLLINPRIVILQGTGSQVIPGFPHSQIRLQVASPKVREHGRTTPIAYELASDTYYGLGIVTSMAYHPQTDSQSERTNQRLEQYLRIFIDYHQQNWASLLPLAQYTLNSWPNVTTKNAPFELILGHIPQVHQSARPFKSPSVETRLQALKEAREEAKEALWKAADIVLPTHFEPYQIGDKVWLEGCNLNTTHPSSKLASRHYSPFPITCVVSCTSYQLKLPSQWKLHDVFHATLLTLYKETALNGQSYQEPTPELINGQPEWEVESLLKVRR